MSRIYRSESRGATYQGSAQSLGFNPQQSEDQSRKLQEYKAAIAADGETMTRELLRQQQVENTYLELQQRADAGKLRLEGSQEEGDLKRLQLKDAGDLRMTQQLEKDTLAQSQLYQKGLLEQDHLHKKLKMGLEATHLQMTGQVQQAKLQATSTAIQGLLSFAGSVVQYSGQMASLKKQQEAEAYENAKIQSLNESMGFGSSFFDGGAPTPEAVENGNAMSVAMNAESQALGDAANDIRSSGSPEDLFVAEQVESMSSWNQTADSRGNVYAARMQYPAFIAEAAANGLIRPGAQGAEDLNRLNQKFARAAGLHMADPKMVAEVFSSTASGIAMNTLSEVNRQAAQELKAARLSKLDNNISTLVDGLGPMSGTSQVGAVWEQANQENVNGQYGGRMSMSSNLSTTEKVLKELASEGKADAIARLREYEYNPNRKGATLGKDFDSLFDKYEKEARQTTISDFNLDAAERNVQTKQSIQFFYDDPSPENRRSAIATLRSIGTEEALKEANRLAENGLGYDPQKKFELLEMKQQGQHIPQDMLEQLLRDGTINEAEYKQFASTSADVQTATKVDAYLKDMGTGLKAAMQGKAGPQDLTSDVRAQIATRYPMMMDELRTRVLAEVKSNPSIADNPAELARIVETYSQQLLKQPQYRLEADPKKGYYFPGEISSDRRLAQITVAPGVQDFSKLKPEDIFGKLQYPKTEMDASRDRFLKPEELKADVKKIMEGGTPSNRSRLFAKNLGLSSTAFIEMQLEAAGLPSLNSLRQQDGNLSYGGGAHDIPNASAGMKAIKSLGFPTKGAAYLAGNIQQESTWHGLREWGQVAGDGTNRNGGLISWASWSNDSARLGAIERHFGKNIAQIPEMDQLRYMVTEMKRRNPDAYRVFMNPNSSDAALRKASYQYWGYEHEGARFTYANNLLSYGRI